MLESFVRAKLEEMEKALMQKHALKMFEHDCWANDIPSGPGVYVIWDVKSSKKPVYVGESSSLRSRMKDIGKIKKHTFRRKAKKELKVTSNDEAVLSAEMSKRYEVSFIEVLLGRAELEEFLVKRWLTVWNKSAKNARVSTTNG